MHFPRMTANAPESSLRGEMSQSMTLCHHFFLIISLDSGAVLNGTISIVYVFINESLSY